MRSHRTAALLALVALAAASPAAGDIRFSMRDGRVSIVAKDATVGEILAEWARVGQMKVVNLEAIPRETVTIELIDVSEEQALAVLLRHVSGYIAARRATVLADASTFDRILVMPQSARGSPAVAAAVAAADDPPDSTLGDDGPTDPVTGQVAADPVAAYQDPAARDAMGQAAAAARAGDTADYPAANPAGGYPVVAYPMAAPLAASETASRPSPPPRPMASGQMAGRRAAAPATESPRDRQVVTPPEPAAVNPGLNPLEETAPPPATVEIPAEDPVAQAVFKARRAAETVNPREFNFPRPQPVVPGKPPGAPGGR